MSNYNYDYPFTIVDVVQALNIPVRRITNNAMYIDCPCCVPNLKNGHDGKGKCEVIINKNCWHCCRCDHGGGMLELFCKVKNCDMGTANQEMRTYVGHPSYAQKKQEVQKIIQTAESSIIANSNLAPKSVVDNTYRHLISLCSLCDKHRKHLREERKLTDKAIEHFGLVSVPYKFEERKRIIRSLQKDNCRLKGVPGFYINKAGYWDINFNKSWEGIIIPMVNLNNQCLGLQIRLDVPFEDAKYVWCSSKNKSEGVARTSVPHITNTKNIGEYVYLTEGGLKADIAHIYSKRTFAAIAGVTQLKIMPIFLNQLKQRGVKYIVDCFDTDCKDNVQVEKSRQKLKTLTQNAGLDYLRMDWDNRYKGIDDYLVYVPRGERAFVIYDS